MFWDDISPAVEARAAARVMSRPRRRAEHAAPRLVRPAADPHFSVRARRRLVVGDELAAIDDPACAVGHNAFGRFAIIFAAAPFADLVLVSALADPGIVSQGGRRAQRKAAKNRGTGSENELRH